MIRPFPKAKLIEKIAHAQTLITLDRQDSYGAQGGNMSLEIRAALQEAKLDCEVYTRIYGLGGKDFYYEEAVKLVKECVGQDLPKFDYLQISEGQAVQEPEYFKPLSAGDTELGFTRCVLNEQGRPQVQGGQIAATTGDAETAGARSWSVSGMRHSRQCEPVAARHRRSGRFVVSDWLRHGRHDLLSENFL